MAKVSLTKVSKDIYAAVTKTIDELGQQVITPGDHVLIKPNLVMPADPDSGEITNFRLIEAVARYCLDCGAARVIIGEGPSYYLPESRLRECFTSTGICEVANRLGIEWVLFDEYGYRTFKGVSDCTPEKFRITEFTFTCDKFINLPVLKTHYYTKVTLAMKNLKGCLKREDKPRFHNPDLSRAVVELCKIIRPSINIIDCTPKTIARRLGVGYSDSEQPVEGLLISGSDIVAVDAVGSALMGIDPEEVYTVSLGAATGLGEADLTRVDIVGEQLKLLKFKIKLPQEELQHYFPLLEITGADRACSGCLIPLISALLLLGERGVKMKKPLTICLSKNPQVPEYKPCLLVGDCVEVKGKELDNKVTGCPPDRGAILDSLVQAVAE